MDRVCMPVCCMCRWYRCGYMLGFEIGVEERTDMRNARTKDILYMHQDEDLLIFLDICPNLLT